MTLNRHNNLAVHVVVANSGRYGAGTYRRTDCSRPRTSRREDLTPPTESGRLAGYLLAWTVPVAFCSGLVGLAVSPLFEVAVPGWLILAHGIDCVLVALLALLLARPWQQPSHRMGADANRDWAATWNGLLERLSAHRPPRSRSSDITYKPSQRETNHEERQPTSAHRLARLQADLPGRSPGRYPQGAER